MKFTVVQTFEVEADSEEKAKLVIQKLEEKNLQGLFLKKVSAYLAEPERRIWKLW
ncbi:MAG TPA: hypothetical protein VEL49_03810 [Ktedonobacteraceae bacterium]|nr:hypothetical protein [Ktedonobacteraceae bacterium]